MCVYVIVGIEKKKPRAERVPMREARSAEERMVEGGVPLRIIRTRTRESVIFI